MVQEVVCLKNGHQGSATSTPSVSSRRAFVISANFDFGQPCLLKNKKLSLRL